MRITTHYALRAIIILAVVAAGSLAFFAFAERASAELKAFPTAEGFGAGTIGGRGGAVIEVTNLNNSGTGSLRACVDASGPRTCVFRVGGTIVLNQALKILNPFITIAGQTAPGGGITIRNALTNYESSIDIKTHDVIMRYIRVRTGPADQKATLNVDNVDTYNSSGGIYNIIFDHASFSWSTDENLGFWGAWDDVTVQWSIISEGLNCSTDTERTCQNVGDHGHSKGMLVGSDGAGNISIHHNLLAHNFDRNPWVKTSSRVNDIVNNVIYNSVTNPIRVTSESGGQQANVVGNFMKTGVNSSWSSDISTDSSARLYVSGNIGPHRTSDALSNTLSVDVTSSVVTTPFVSPPIQTTTAQQAYDQVLAGAGATVPGRDAVDKRILAEVVNGGGSVIDSPSEILLSPDGNIFLTRESYTKYGITDPIDDYGWPILSPGTPPPDTDHDGMPDAWESANGLNINDASDRNGDLDGDGYTNLEEYLNSIDSGVVPPPPPLSDTTPPTTPAMNTPTVVSSSQINISWTASTDASGIANYELERCTGSSCTTFAQIATPTGTTYSNTGLSANTAYRFRVRAKDGASPANYSVYSNIVSATTQNIPAAGDLIAHWKFDEGSGGTTQDASLSGNTGTISGASWTASGHSGPALSFDGIDDYVSVGTNGLNPSSGTVAAWVKPSSFAATHYIFGHTTFPQYASRIQLYTDDTAGNLDLGIGDSHTTATGIFDLATAAWQHVALTWNSGTYAVYVNGIERRTGSYTNLTTNYGTAAIGNGYTGSNQSWNGVIDEVRLYNRALSASEVASLAGSGGGGTKSPDLNSDGIVNSLDWSIMNSQWGGSGTADLNSDGIVNSLDWSIMNSQWGTAGGSTPPPPPPPPPSGDTTPPTVSLTAPANGATVSGTSVTVSASASDNIGVSGVQFYLNGLIFGSEDTTSPYSILWNTTTGANGSYTITARARDAAGNQTTSAGVSVTVSNTITPPPPPPPPPAGGTTAANYTVAFTADTGKGSSFQSVLNLIKNERVNGEPVDALFIPGDLSYSDLAGDDAWISMVNSTLGSSFPVFLTKGNHETSSAWSAKYGPFTAENITSTGISPTCIGQLSSNAGRNTACTIQGFRFVLSDAGESGKEDSPGTNTNFINTALTGSPSIWRLCVWHRNQNKLQPGGKSDEVGWAPYEACRTHGAMVINGHEHSYSRTKSLVNMITQTVDSAASDPANPRVAPGSTFVAVVGLGGSSVRTQQRCLPETYPYGCNGEWAKIYTSNQGATYGALFVTFNVGGDPRKATAYFKNINGQIVDQFTVRTDVNP